MYEKADSGAISSIPGTAEVSPGYTFLIQSQVSLGEDLPPRQGNAPNFKNKRKRTSPQDHSILEAAYQKNSKPDKAERADIVGRVQLGEKEVQIWFQNRRQNDRRRSKPLEPHELLAHFRNTIPNSASTQDLSLASPLAITENATSNSSSQSSESTEDTSFKTSHPALSEIDRTPDLQSSGETATSKFSTQDQSTSPSTVKTQDGELQEPVRRVDDATAGCGDLCDGQQYSSEQKGNEDFLQEDESANRARSAIDQLLPRSREPLKRSSSIHLSMTMDGSVKIRTDNDPTPSPPKSRVTACHFKNSTQPITGKRNVDAIDIFKDAQHERTTKKIGAGFGRSRDARTWEFYCDNASNEALSNQAEAETTGSAVGAINLIRSNIPKLRPQLSNTNLSRSNIRPMTRNDKANKPKLGRCKSSMARLQSLSESISAPDVEKRPHHVRSPSGDSDKENWAPGTRASENALRRTQPTNNARPILRENESVIFQDIVPVHGSSRPARSDDKDSPRKETAKGEDLDCIQGLLSLSQGAWK